MIPLPLLAANWKLAAAAGVAAAFVAVAGWGLYWRGEYRELKAAQVVLEDQVKVLAHGVRACNAGVAQAKETAAGVLVTANKLLLDARRAQQERYDSARRLEKLLRQKPPARADGKPAGCDDAWDLIEKNAGAP